MKPGDRQFLSVLGLVISSWYNAVPVENFQKEKGAEVPTDCLATEGKVTTVEGRLPQSLPTGDEVERVHVLKVGP